LLVDPHVSSIMLVFPMQPPTLEYVTVDGLRIAVWQWPGEDPPLLFAHATGFHARCWDQLIRELPGRRVVAMDFRGHGRSDKPEPPYHWSWFARDVAAVAGQLDLRGAIGIGHSMGGHSVVEAAAMRPDAFSSLLLVDPTIFEAAYYGLPRRHDASFILRRRNQWKSWEEMFERFRNRPPFAQWRPEVLRDYCEFGVLPRGEEYVLACPPQVEAAIYAASNAPESNLYPLLPRIQVPVTVMRGDRLWSLESFDLMASPTAAGLAAQFPRGRDVLLEGRNHYIPMETPDLVARQIAALIHS
jgi:pimeloyl-ACP methyl ester carboxylesterase